MINLHVFGAFDRYNYGDTLFPYIIEYFANKYLNDYTLYYYGIEKRDLSKFGCKSTESIANMNNEGKTDFYINAGGNSLVAKIDLLYLDNVEKITKLYFERFVRLFLKSKYIKIVKKKLNIDRDFPYDIQSKKMIYNGVGGNLNALPNTEKEKVNNILNLAGYLSVRDKVTYESIEKKDNVLLIPDTAIILSDIWDKDYLNKQYKYKFNTLDEYIIVQLNHGLAKNNIQQIVKIINILNNKYSKKILLLPIGYAKSHGDLQVLSKIHKMTMDITYFFDCLTIEETTYLIQNSLYLIGTSLHANLVSFSYGVSSLLIAEENTKNYNYHKTWLNETTCTLVTSEEFFNSNLELLEKDGNINLSEIKRQKSLVYEHFGNLKKFIESEINDY